MKNKLQFKRVLSPYFKVAGMNHRIFKIRLIYAVLEAFFKNAKNLIYQRSY